MDIIFNCPKCEQELAVDGWQRFEITAVLFGKIVGLKRQNLRPPRPSHPRNGVHGSSMSSSAAAKVEMHLKVPVHDKPAASLIEKPSVPLEVAAKESDKKMKVKTIRHTDCVEVGHDKFDEVVTGFLQKVGETNIVSLTPMTYTHLDIGSQKLMTDYAVMVIYRG